MERALYIIRALKGAPKGKCLKIASTSGMCVMLVMHSGMEGIVGSTESAITLRNSRDREDRATKVGVVHRHCSKQQKKPFKNETNTQNQKLLRL